MSFFRRIFNNTPEEDASQEVDDVVASAQDAEDDEVVTSASVDTEASSGDDLPSDVPPTQELPHEFSATEELPKDVPPTEELPPDVPPTKEFASVDEDVQDVAEQSDETPNNSDDVTLPDVPSEFKGVTEDLSSTRVPVLTRPLSESDTFTIPAGGHLIFGQASDQGVKRMSNQDAVFTFYFTSETAEEFPDFGVFVVADGMGGHQDGEKASAITARTVATELLEKVYAPLLQGVDMNDPDRATIIEVLVDAVNKANEAVRDNVKDGGTTLTAAVIRGETAHIAHVGDSRAYWVNENQSLDKITRDHSVVERLIELGQITREEAEFHDQRNVLYRAIGQNDDVEVEIHRKRLVPNCGLLLCSDGLWNMVNDDDILAIIKQTPDPQETCQKLVALANAHGGADNITAIFIRTPSK